MRSKMFAVLSVLEKAQKSGKRRMTLAEIKDQVASLKVDLIWVDLEELTNEGWIQCNDPIQVPTPNRHPVYQILPRGLEYLRSRRVERSILIGTWIAAVCTVITLIWVFAGIL